MNLAVFISSFKLWSSSFGRFQWYSIELEKSSFSLENLGLLDGSDLPLVLNEAEQSKVKHPLAEAGRRREWFWAEEVAPRLDADFTHGLRLAAPLRG